MKRRGFLGAVLAAGAAPAILTQGVIMPLGKVWVPNSRMTPAEVILLANKYPHPSIEFCNQMDKFWSDLICYGSAGILQTPHGLTALGPTELHRYPDAIVGKFNRTEGLS